MVFICRSPSVLKGRTSPWTCTRFSLLGKHLPRQSARAWATYRKLLKKPALHVSESAIPKAGPGQRSPLLTASSLQTPDLVTALVSNPSSHDSVLSSQRAPSKGAFEGSKPGEPT